METAGVFLATAIVALTMVIYAYVQNRKYPPGPYGLPLLGYLPFVEKYRHRTFANLRKRYGNVVSVSLGGRKFVILNDLKAVKEALVVQGETFAGRPTRHRVTELIGKKDLALASGPIWKEQKRFSIRTLRGLGFGRSSIEHDVTNEVEKLSDHLKSKDGEPVEITDLFFLPLLNIMCKVICDSVLHVHSKERTFNMENGRAMAAKGKRLTCLRKRYEKEDAEFRVLKESFAFLKLLNFQLSIFFPFLKILFPRRFCTERIASGATQMANYLKREVTSHLNDLSDNNLQDFMDIYLAEIGRSERVNGKETPPFTRAHLIETSGDLFFGGVDTTESTLLWAFLYVAHNPKIQTKIQQELDGLMAVDSVLSPSSKALVPYTQAALLEVQRCASVVPLALPHRVIRDTVLLGHNVPKDTIVFTNLYAVHHDERHWGDPQVFRPERFLEAQGGVIKDENLMPFSVGPRFCPGESMAKTTLFQFFTCLLRRFTFSFVQGEPQPTLEPGSMGHIVKPHPYSLVVECRH